MGQLVGMWPLGIVATLGLLAFCLLGGLADVTVHSAPIAWFILVSA